MAAFSQVDEAKFACLIAHEGQVDKCGEPYHLHPFAVADMVEGEERKAVAYLHDVVEDTETTLEQLADMGFSANIVEAVDAITRRDGEEYMDYITRVKVNPIATDVKVADLKHNMNPNRRGATRRMLERYASALAELTRR